MNFYRFGGAMVEKWGNDMFFSHFSSIVRFSCPKIAQNVVFVCPHFNNFKKVLKVGEILEVEKFG